MPTSPWSNIQQIFDIVMDLRPYPSRVLDVGIGYGKFGLLCKEYISFWNSPDKPREIVVDGIEVFHEYIGPLQYQIYNNIFLGDASEVLPQLPDSSYDLVLLVDVLEHFNREEGIKVLSECRRVGKVVVVSTPRQFWPQGDSWGNPYERHRSLWSRQDFLAVGAVRVIRAENWIVVFATPPYADRFSWAYRIWRHGNQWTPAWLRPYVRWLFKTFFSKTPARDILVRL